jgi:hypothetical protein
MGWAVVYEGWMWKRREQKKTWKKRYFRLMSDNYLYYYTSEITTSQEGNKSNDQPHLIGKIDLSKPDLMIHKTAISEKYRYCFKLSSKSASARGGGENSFAGGAQQLHSQVTSSPSILLTMMPPSRLFCCVNSAIRDFWVLAISHILTFYQLQSPPP